MTTREIRQHCQLNDAGTNLLRSSIQEMGLSARAHDKVLRVARTIADLDGSAEITARARQRSGQLPHARPAILELITIELKLRATTDIGEAQAYRLLAGGRSE